MIDGNVTNKGRQTTRAVIVQKPIHPTDLYITPSNLKTCSVPLLAIVPGFLSYLGWISSAQAR